MEHSSFFATFRIHPQGGLIEERIAGLWSDIKYLAGFALLARACLNLYSVCKMVFERPRLGIPQALWWLFAVVYGGHHNRSCVPLAVRIVLKEAASASLLQVLRCVTLEFALKGWDNLKKYLFPRLRFVPCPAICAAIVYVSAGSLLWFHLGCDLLEMYFHNLHDANDGAYFFMKQLHWAAFANQMVSITSESEVSLDVAFRFGFAREDATLQVEEDTAIRQYTKDLCHMIDQSPSLTPLQKVLLLLTWDSADIQKLLIENQPIHDQVAGADRSATCPGSFLNLRCGC